MNTTKHETLWERTQLDRCDEAHEGDWIVTCDRCGRCACEGIDIYVNAWNSIYACSDCLEIQSVVEDLCQNCGNTFDEHNQCCGGCSEYDHNVDCEDYE